MSGELNNLKIEKGELIVTLPEEIEKENVPSVTVTLSPVSAHFMSGEARGNWICVTVREDKEVAYALLHELGHLMGQAVGPEDLENFPGITKANEYYYTGRGHNGPHCSFDRDNKEDVDYTTVKYQFKCIMFGNMPRKVPEEPKYCEHCQKFIRAWNLAEFHEY